MLTTTATALMIIAMALGCIALSLLIIRNIILSLRKPDQFANRVTFDGEMNMDIDDLMKAAKEGKVYLVEPEDK